MSRLRGWLGVDEGFNLAAVVPELTVAIFLCDKHGPLKPTNIVKRVASFLKSFNDADAVGEIGAVDGGGHGWWRGVGGGAPRPSPHTVTRHGHTVSLCPRQLTIRHTSPTAPPGSAAPPSGSPLAPPHPPPPPPSSIRRAGPPRRGCRAPGAWPGRVVGGSWLGGMRRGQGRPHTLAMVTRSGWP
jgi:hypothetical protein